LSATALLSAHDAALVDIGISASSDPVTDQIGTVDPSDNDPEALSLLADPINPIGKLVHHLALDALITSNASIRHVVRLFRRHT
jgi:hypothetical protein